MPDTVLLDTILLDTLPPRQRLALAYAAAPWRAAWLALFALDARLATVVRSAREPVLGQLRLAWWRDRLAQSSGEWPEGEPLLAALRAWDGRHAALSGLVDAWEHLLGEAPLASDCFATFAQGRGKAMAAMAHLTGAGESIDVAESLAIQWALGDLRANLGHPAEQAVVDAMLPGPALRKGPLPRVIRPLAVLHATTFNSAGVIRNGAFSGLLAGIRTGIFGR